MAHPELSRDTEPPTSARNQTAVSKLTRGRLLRGGAAEMLQYRHAGAHRSHADQIALPDDVWLMVLSYFSLEDPARLGEREYRERTHALKRLCLVSKGFLYLAQPVLYHFFEVCNMHDNEKRSAPRHVNNFLRGLCLRPELGSMVRHISLNPWTSLKSEFGTDPIRAMEYYTPDPMLTTLFIT